MGGLLPPRIRSRSAQAAAARHEIQEYLHIQHEVREEIKQFINLCNEQILSVNNIMKTLRECNILTPEDKKSLDSRTSALHYERFLLTEELEKYEN